MSVGDPELDMFTEHAYRFSVFVPAALAPRPQDRQMLRRAISAECPAHTKGELVLVRPAMCLGTQSHLGLDSMLAATAPLRLTCAQSIEAARDWGEEVAGSRIDGLSGARHVQDLPQLAARTAGPGQFAAAGVMTRLKEERP